MTGLYLHIPFCVRKCPYCSFYSYPGGMATMLEFVEAAVKEIAALKSSSPAGEIETVYIGGGTPTALTVDCLRDLLDALSPFIKDGVEFTCEANPDSATSAKIEVLKEYGINRLSLGMQSFSDEHLKTLGRLHDSQVALNAFEAARDAGFGNISIDLMYGLPQQTISDWDSDLRKAIELNPEHVSFYGLTIDEGTKFERLYKEGEASRDLPDEDAMREMYYRGIDRLEAAGFIQYEISNFARPGYESRHNINYWRHGKYYAVGPSASGFDGKRRWVNIADTQKYIDCVKSGKSVVAEEELLPREQLISEAVILGLRLREGIDLNKLSAKFETDLDKLYSSAIHNLINLGMLERIGHSIRLTRDGLFVSNSVMLEFII